MKYVTESNLRGRPQKNALWSVLFRRGASPSPTPLSAQSPRQNAKGLVGNDAKGFEAFGKSFGEVRLEFARTLIEKPFKILQQLRDNLFHLA